MTCLPRTLLALSLLAAPLAGQASVYSEGCPGLLPTPDLQLTGGLLPGQQATLVLSGTAPDATTLLLVGTQDTTPEGEPLEVPLDGVAGMQPGCTLNTDVLYWALGQTDAGGSQSVTFGVPAGLGADVNFQFAVVESAAPLSLVMSPALRLHIPLVVSPDAPSVQLGATRAGELGDPQLLTLTNETPAALTLDGLALLGEHPDAFSAVPLQPLPLSLAPGELLQVQLVATPQQPGFAQASLVVQHAGLPASFSDPAIALHAVGLGPPGAELLLDAGGAGGYVDGVGQTWVADGGFEDAQIGSSAGGVSGTNDPQLYQTWREGADFDWSVPLPDGTYELTLHAVDMQHTAFGQRIFDVFAEGQLLLDDLDLVRGVGAAAAFATTRVVEVSDGALDLDFVASVDVATISALEVRSQNAVLVVTPGSHDFGPLPWSAQSVLALDVANQGNAALELESLVFHMHTGAGSDFVLDLDGQQYTGLPDAGGHMEIELPASLSLGVGESSAASMTWSPSQAGPSMLQLQWHGNFESVVQSLSGTGGGPDHPYLAPHVVTPGPQVDWGGFGSAPVALDGSGSSTQQPGHVLTDWTWSSGGQTLDSGEQVVLGFGVGSHDVCLTIADDHVPPETASLCVPVEVVTPAAVPGVLASYWDTSPADPAGSLFTLPGVADWTELRAEFGVPAGPSVGGSPLAAQVLVRLRAELELPAGDYDLIGVGGSARAVFVDGVLVSGAHTLGPGPHAFELRFAVGDGDDLPLDLLVGPAGGGDPAPLAAALLSHDETAEPPALNGLSPAVGSEQGGELINLVGAAWFPTGDVRVHWGPVELSGPELQIDAAQSIQLVAPALPPGVIDVVVQTPAGSSAARTFTVSEDVDPQVGFAAPLVTQLPPGTSCATWAPDGRLYVGLLDGRVVAVSFDDDWSVLDTQTYPGVSALPNHELLAMAVDPFAPSDPVRLHVAHTDLLAQGGAPPLGPVPYPGAVSVLEGPSFDSPQGLVGGLPTSNFLHGPTALQFDHAGDLLIAVGGNTNAGVSADAMGALPESPLSGALLEARTSDPGFDGQISYVDTASGQPDADQRHGEQVSQASGDVSVRAAGLRNPSGLVLSDAGWLYALDQGAVFGLGEASSGPGSSAGEAQGQDELLRLEQGHYLGHANRARGRDDPRQDVWHDDLAPALPGVFQQALVGLAGPSTGLTQYTARSFGDALRGELLVQTAGAGLRRVRLSPDGAAVEQVSDLLPGFGARSVFTGPGGAILGLDLSGSLQVARPVDPGAGGFAVYDVFPDRAPATGGTPFVIGGVGLGHAAITGVRFGGQPALLDSVSDTRIRGTIPATTPGVERLDVVVDVAGDTRTLDGAFRSLFVPAGSEPARWLTGAPTPVGLSEVSAGIIDDVLYMLGDGDDGTYAYDLASDTWSGGLAPRPFPGDHQPCEVWGGKLYLLGGLGQGADGKVQIYDPVSDSWSLGATMPWNAGSSCTAVLGDKIYVAGGIKNNSSTSNKVAAYDPVSDSWGPFLAGMLDPRNHAASGTDGERLWVFGGRGPGSGDTNVLANGFADVQVYDPLSDSWDSSALPGSELQPLPIGRGGAGKAAWYHGEFHVFGGETLDGPGATADNVYARVDVYDPATHTWRLETPLPTPRHGSFPIVFENRVYVIAGGWKASTSFTAVNEILLRD